MAPPVSDYVDANGVRLHYIRKGAGLPLLLLHGWPEYCRVWEPVIDRLDDRFDLVAPDLRGFGDSDKPERGPSATAAEQVHAADLHALLSSLGIGRFGIVAHDVGVFPAQLLADREPQRVVGLFFFDCPNPGIRDRWRAPSQLIESWHLYFNQMPWAADLLGTSRQACRLFIGHFLRHWSGRKDAFDPVLDQWVDNFLKPGNLQGGFNWYISRHAARVRMMSGERTEIRRITVPTCVRWGDQDPATPVAWADRLGDFFSDLDVASFPGAGHFPHFEFPDRAANEIGRFFGQRG